ncbi:MAG TPA: tRNA (adenosine(37)-N6)-threonylcarbamoyltransferase complex dimerization subunit type 1 TsaB [Spirochaetota bacterium]|nr:tRNA (adenosine(37)-N6)-threonylcarbamoyltransferase complex dimerization subunit type 1 TsaB [Spirochaetota bacterium]HOM38679.1 tRNA (adenosine(37)-N6)-threonylcarbamoyltransferase complex dimerization subunit type 1 TsaB [Spirochaetota bacterium]HPQ49806.1 tRNA (adenosine(37)-N6)-threonylcarbamoyltransferase complex dimerization subunit type 1 TsaB [Spirochaetota bacterium]
MKLVLSSSTDIFCCGIIDNNSNILTSIYVKEKKIQDKILKIIDFIKVLGYEYDSIGIDVGPGGFTGLRIGFSVIKTISFIKKIPVYGAYSLDLIRYNTVSDRVVSGIDGNGRIFLRVYEKENKSDIFDFTITEALKFIEDKKLYDYEFIGNAFLNYSKYFSNLRINDRFYYPTVDSFSKCLVGPYNYEILPYYGRKSQAEELKC